MWPRVRDLEESRRTWRKIGGSFARSRPSPWSQVTAWLGQHGGHDPVLDLAGGHGRHSAPLVHAGRHVVVADISRESLAARSPGSDAVESSATALPFRDGAFPTALFIAGLHAIPGAGNRAAALEELRRVLGPGGRALVSVWHRDQPRFADAVARGEREVMQPWSTAQGPVDRYTYLFDETSLRDALEAAGFTMDRVWSEAVSARHVDNVFASVVNPS